MAKQDFKDYNINPIGGDYYLFSNKAPKELSVFNQTENTSDKIINYGTGNNYPNDLVKYVMASPIATACVETHAKFLMGDGLMITTKEGNQSEFTQKLYRLFNDSFFSRLCYDMAYFEAFATIQKYDLNANLDSIKNQDFSTVRLGVPDDNFEITYAMLSSSWQQKNKKKEFTPVRIDLFNDIEVKKTIENFGTDVDAFQKWNGTLAYIRRYKPSQTYYSQPKYAAAYRWIYIDAMIQDFHANNMDNSFAPAFILYVPFKLDGKDENGKDKKESLREYVTERLTGADNGGKFAIIDGATKDASIQIVPFNQSTNHEMYITLQNLVRENITTAFQVPPPLAGIQVAGKLGNAQEIADYTLYYQNTVIKPDQNMIVAFLNRMARFVSGYEVGTNISISNSVPLGFLAGSFGSNFSEDEIRAAWGYGPRPQKVSDSAQAIINNLNSLSPLVATKVLERMDDAEIRKLVGLPEKQITPPNTPTS